MGSSLSLRPMGSSLSLRSCARRGLCDSLDAELGLRRTMTKRLTAQRRNPPAPPTRLEGAVARVSTVKLHHGASSDLSRAYELKGSALYKSIPGFVGSVLLVDRETDTARSVTMWNSVASMNDATDHPDCALARTCCSPARPRPITLLLLSRVVADAQILQSWESWHPTLQRPPIHRRGSSAQHFSQMDAA